MGALQDLLSEYMVNAGNKATPQLDLAIDTMCKKTRDLRRQLRKAVVDHVSDSFLESATPSWPTAAAPGTREGRGLWPSVTQ